MLTVIVFFIPLRAESKSGPKAASLDFFYLFQLGREEIAHSENRQDRQTQKVMICVCDLEYLVYEDRCM